MATEYTECQAFCPWSSELGPPTPTHASAIVAQPPLGPGGDTRAGGGQGGGGTQFGRLARNSGALTIISLQ
jgi:hypothetical protein